MVDERGTNRLVGYLDTCYIFRQVFFETNSAFVKLQLN